MGIDRIGQEKGGCVSVVSLGGRDSPDLPGFTGRVQTSCDMLESLERGFLILRRAGKAGGVGDMVLMCRDGRFA